MTDKTTKPLEELGSGLNPEQEKGLDPESSETPVDWQSMLDEKTDADLLENSIFEGKDLRQLLTELAGAQSLLGRKGLIVPKDEDKAEVWDTFYNKLGRPKTASDYQLDLTDVEEADWYSNDLNQHMCSLMHKAGLSNQQAGLIAGGFKDFLKSNTDENEVYQQANDVSQQLADHWGADAEANEVAAERGAHNIGLSADMLATLLRIGQPVAVWDTLANIGKAQSEDTGLNNHKDGDAMSAKDAQRELERLSGDRSHVCAFLNPGHAKHQQARTLRSKLVRLAAG